MPEDYSLVDGSQKEADEEQSVIDADLDGVEQIAEPILLEEDSVS